MPPATMAATVLPTMPVSPPTVADKQVIAPTTEPNNTNSKSVISQALEDQNIFFLLGVTDGTDEEKEAFLDELQQVIWEDFLENDVELLVTEEEMVDLKKIMARKDTPESQLQEEMVAYLEKLIPDLEEIMLEKALELKEDMVKERIAGMRQYHQDRPEVISQLSQVETLISDNQWRAAADIMNNIAD